jgi:hypothetical protein
MIDEVGIIQKKLEILMRQILTLLLLTLTIPAWAETAPPSTKLEDFSSKKGMVIIKSYEDAGLLAGRHKGYMSISAMELTSAPPANEKLKGIKISIFEDLMQKNGSSVFIDFDEIEGLLKSIDYIAKEKGSAAKFKRFEASYVSNSGFQFTVFNSNSTGKLYLSIDTGKAMSITYLSDMTDVDLFRTKIVKAQSLLLADVKPLDIQIIRDPKTPAP